MASKEVETIVTNDIDTNSELPTPRIRGSFMLYDLPDGGIHVAWIPDGVDDSETQHFELPGKILRLAQMAAEGKLSIAQLAKAMMGD